MSEPRTKTLYRRCPFCGSRAIDSELGVFCPNYECPIYDVDMTNNEWNHRFIEKDPLPSIEQVTIQRLTNLVEKQRNITTKNNFLATKMSLLRTDIIKLHKNMTILVEDVLETQQEILDALKEIEEAEKTYNNFTGKINNE